MENSANLELPYIMPSQAQKHVTHNEALRLLDALIQLCVINRTETAPPPAPDEGDRYIVGAGATGTWTGWDHAIAYYVDGGWMKLEPRPGWRSWVESSNEMVAWNGATWISIDGLTGDAAVDSIGIGTAPNPVNRLAVKSDAALFNHDDVTPGSGNMKVNINKASSSKEAGLFFQDGASARAGLGCLGSDNFQIKVSTDGAAWKSAIDVMAANGNVGIGTANPKARLHVSSGGSGSYRAIVVSSSESDSAQKGGMICGARYTLANEPFVCFGSWDSGTTRDVYYGGGGWNMPDATHLRFYTAPAYSETPNTGLLRMTITPSGDVGIGTSSPTAKLHVNGSVSKTSGSFDIPHPDPARAATHRLRHCFVEAPTRGENLYRFGVEAAAPGMLVVPLPDYWHHLNENPQVWVSPVGHHGRAWGTVNETLDELRVHCETSGRYNILLIGTRADSFARDYFDPLGVEYEQTFIEEPDFVSDRS